MTTEEVRMLYAGAVGFVDAAQILFAHPETAKREGLILPTHTCLALAIEMGFKAIYLHRGGDLKAIEKNHKVRHNLGALRDLCEGVGFTSCIPGVNQIVAVIGDNYAAHDYRYMKPNTEIKFVKGDGVVPTVLRFVDEVALAVGLPARPGAV